MMMPNQSTILRRLCCLHARMLLAVLPLLLVGCGVHEFPDVPDTAKVSLHLRFDTDMPQVYYTLSRTGAPVQVTSVRTRGTMRYIIRLYPQASAAQAIPVREYIVRRDVSQGYDADIDLDAPAGSYRVMVWADLSDDDAGVGGFYDASDFSSIRALMPYQGSTDYRDAFRGEAEAVVATSTSEQAPVGVTVQMTRPLAKFEFVANDVRLFIEQQSAAIAGHMPVDPSTGAATPAVDLDMFTVRIIYNGYAPNTYNIFTDKPTDAIMGVACDGRMERLSADEASLGFDYVLVNGHASEVTVQLGIYDRQGRQVSLSRAVNVPLQRSRHTIIRGEFLTQTATGGVSVNPGYDGEFNVFY